MTLRVREKGRLRKVGHTTMASAQNPQSVVPLALKKSSTASMATLSHAPWWFIAHSQPVAIKVWFGPGVSLS